MCPPMDELHDLSLPESFGGQVRLLPLPNLVMFPYVLQPLHIFEPRYRRMTEAILEGDELMAVALLQPGWEADYEGRPPIHPVVCVGKVIAHARLEDGRYNLMLHGLRRASVIREHPPDEPYRVAEVAVLEDLYPSGGDGRRARLRDELLTCFRGVVPSGSPDGTPLSELDPQEISLGALVDIVAHSLNLNLASKQELLAEWNVDLRALKLLERLREFARGDRSEDGGEFPPPFSVN